MASVGGAPPGRDDRARQGACRAAPGPAPRLPHGGTPARLAPTEQAMLRWALIFAIIAVIAGALGFTGIEAGAADIARLLFYVFVALVVIFLVLGITIFKR
jgi:uncharacterized membrane protein YtjA (UPF0391 family)